MKKLLALILSLVMVCSFAACFNKDSEGGDSSEGGESSSIATYMEENGDELIEDVESSFATSSGMTCKSDWEVDGDTLIIDIKINELDEVPDETKELLQETYDNMTGDFDEMFADMQKEMPDLEAFVLNVCEKDGDILAVIEMD